MGQINCTNAVSSLARVVASFGVAASAFAKNDVASARNAYSKFKKTLGEHAKDLGAYKYMLLEKRAEFFDEDMAYARLVHNGNIVVERTASHLLTYAVDDLIAGVRMPIDSVELEIAENDSIRTEMSEQGEVYFLAQGNLKKIIIAADGSIGEELFVDIGKEMIGLVLSNNGEHLITRDKSAFYLYKRTTEQKMNFVEQIDGLSDVLVAFSDTGRKVAIALQDIRGRFRDLSIEYILRTWDFDSGTSADYHGKVNPDSVVITPQGDDTLCAVGNEIVQVEFNNKMAVADAEIQDLRFSPDGTVLFVSSVDGKVFAYNYDVLITVSPQAALITVVEGGFPAETADQQISFSADGNRVMRDTAFRGLEIFEIPS